ncbi:uncharacterized protein [Panulirus ornatus]|uniref:uncharacterized protein isoform X2 n=1 Tax=Panulirus ornatus TaxID=150431 RepID=UPI003A879CC1
MGRMKACGRLASFLLLLLLYVATPTCALLHTQLTGLPATQVTGPRAVPEVGPPPTWPSGEDLVIPAGEYGASAAAQDSPDDNIRISTTRPTTEDLAERVWTRLAALARTAHLPQPRLGLNLPLDPLHSSSTLKYVHEGELLRLRLLLDNLTLEGLKSLSVQEVSFQRPPGDADAFAFTHHQQGGPPGQVRDWYRGHDLRDEPPRGDWGMEESAEDEAWPPLPTARQEGVGGAGAGGGDERRRRSRGRRPRPPATSEGVIRVAFTQVTVRATYQVRGSAGGFFTFRESGDLTLTAPTVFLTSRVNVTLPSPRQAERRRTPRHGRVKVLWLKSDVSVAAPRLTLQPAAYPPEWVRQQVQTKLEELSSDLSHGHGAVRLLLRRWGKLLKKLIHRTARAITK